MKKLFGRITDWEHWPFKVLYAPISVVWLWYIIRSGSVWFFTPSNPKLTFGGMEGEPKKEMYDLLPEYLYPRTTNVCPTDAFDQVQHRIAEAKLNFPLIVKPEVGGQGILFRKLDSEAELKNYHQKTPFEYIIQQLVTYPMEVSIFYYRYPDQPKGTITGFLHKIPLQVTGNGSSTLKELILQHPKAFKRVDELEPKHGMNFDKILPAGEVFKLSYAANHNRGASFIDLRNQIDQKLISVIDDISTRVDDFFYGRYDIMCTNVDDLKDQRNFTILEYNGCGAEPNHFYDTGYTLIEAYKEILMHWKVLYRISRYNYKRGIKYWPFMKGWRFLTNTKKYMSRMKIADKQI